MTHANQLRFIDSLEYQNRILRRILTVMVACIVVVTTAGATYYRAMVVEGSEFVLKDQDGVVRYSLKLDKDNDLVESRFDSNGKKRLTTTVAAGGVMREAFASDGSRSYAEITDENERFLRAIYQDGKIRRKVEVDTEGQVIEAAYDTSRKPRLLHGIAKNGSPSMLMVSAKGEELMQLRPGKLRLAAPGDTTVVALSADEESAGQSMISKDGASAGLVLAAGEVMQILQSKGKQRATLGVHKESVTQEFSDNDVVRLKSAYSKDDLALVVANDGAGEPKAVVAARAKGLAQISLHGAKKKALTMAVGDSVTMKFADESGIERLKTMLVRNEDTGAETAAMFIRDPSGKIALGNIVSPDGTAEFQLLKNEEEAFIACTRPDNGAQLRFFDTRTDGLPRLRLGVLGERAVTQFADEKGNVRMAHFIDPDRAGSIHYDMKGKARLVELSESNGEVGRSILDDDGDVRFSTRLSSTGSFSFYREKSSSETAWDAADAAGTILQILDTASKFGGK